MKENYVYPAKVECVGNLYQVRFVDFPDMTLIEEPENEFMHAAQECLALEILDRERENKEIPEPSVNLSDVIYIHVWMPYFRNATKEVYVKKNVTIPMWLDKLAKENKVSYSAALVKGLKLALGMNPEH